VTDCPDCAVLRARVEALREGLRGYVDVWTANAECEACDENDGFCDEHLEALHTSLAAARRVLEADAAPPGEESGGEHGSLDGGEA
jgi:hypothetical protein